MVGYQLILIRQPVFRQAVASASAASSTSEPLALRYSGLRDTHRFHSGESPRPALPRDREGVVKGSVLEGVGEGVGAYKRQCVLQATDLSIGPSCVSSVLLADQMRDVDGSPGMKAIRDPLPRHRRFAPNPAPQRHSMRMPFALPAQVLLAPAHLSRPIHSAAPQSGGGTTHPCREFDTRLLLPHITAMNTLATEAEVDGKGWLNIHAPAPPGTAPGRLSVVVVWSPPVQVSATRTRPRAGTLPGEVELAADFHAPLEDFRTHSE